MSDGVAGDRRQPGRVDRLLDAAFARFGWRLLLLHAAMSWLLGLPFALGFALLVGRVEEVGADQRLRIAALLIGVYAAATTVGLLGTNRQLRPLARWLERPDEPGAAELALRTLHRLPLGISRWNASIAVFVAIPTALVFLGLTSGVDSAMVVVLVLDCGIAIALGTWFGIAGLQLILRPLIRDASRRLESPPTAIGGISVRHKLLVGMPAVALCAGMLAVLVSAEPGAAWDDILTTTLVVAGFTTLLVVPASLLLAQSTLAPLDDLTDATERLKAGDFETRVPELAGDELGRLAHSFNEALVGLRERERLATENARLLGEIQRLLEEVRASRARIVAASDAERRRVERNVHDGAQQRLVALSLDLGVIVEEAAAVGAETVMTMTADAKSSLSVALAELRELARGLHPSILTSDGLAPSLRELATRAAIPVDVTAPDERFPDLVEATAYFVAAEGLANVAKYARASRAEVSVTFDGEQLVIGVHDDGVGGARASEMSGLAGLADRLAALDGSLAIDSPAGRGTRLSATVPLTSARGT